MHGSPANKQRKKLLPSPACVGRKVGMMSWTKNKFRCSSKTSGEGGNSNIFLCSPTWGNDLANPFLDIFFVRAYFLGRWIQIDFSHVCWDGLVEKPPTRSFKCRELLSIPKIRGELLLLYSWLDLQRNFLLVHFKGISRYPQKKVPLSHKAPIGFP